MVQFESDATNRFVNNAISSALFPFLLCTKANGTVRLWIGPTHGADIHTLSIAACVMVSKPVKFGILSTAHISTVIVNAMHALPQASCVAIASRDIQKAKRFAEAHGVPISCTYDELLHQSIDAVYIPLPTSMKADWAVRCAQAGKHVLVDKPLGSARDVRRMMEACEHADVFLLDGTHFVHSARTKQIQHRIAGGDIGCLRRIEASFSIHIPRFSENIRADPKLEPQGLLGDLGWYCVRSAVTYFGVEKTSNIVSVVISGSTHPSSSSCVHRAAGVVEFGSEHDRVSLCFAFGSSCALHQHAVMLGDKGFLETRDFVVPVNQAAFFEHTRPPHKYTTDTEFIYHRSAVSVNGSGDWSENYPTEERVSVKEPDDYTHPQKMISEFCRIILNNDRSSAKRWGTEALVTQTILDEMMAKLNV